MCNAGVVLYSVPKAGKAELSPERGAGYEPSVLTGEPTRVMTVDGWYDKPIHRPYKWSTTRGPSHDYNTNLGDDSRLTTLAGLGGGSGPDTTCNIRVNGCAGQGTSC